MNDSELYAAVQRFRSCSPLSDEQVVALLEMYENTIHNLRILDPGYFAKGNSLEADFALLEELKFRSDTGLSHIINLIQHEKVLANAG